MKYKKALVTGGAGFIGSHIAKKLVDSGIETVIIDDLSMGARSNVPEGAKLIVADILDYGILKESCKGVDVVFHDAAKVTIRNSFDDFYRDAEVGVMGTVNVLKAMAENKVKKIIYASSMAVYGDNALPIPETGILEPISPYGIGKLTSERYCRLMGQFNNFDVVALRYFNTYGPGQTFTPYVGVITIFINQLLSGQAPVIFGNGKQMRDFIQVDDVARANILAMQKDIRAGIFNIGTGKGTDINQIASLLIAKINFKIKPAYSPMPAGEPADSIALITKAKEALGFEPQFELEDKVDEVISWIKQINENSFGRAI